MKTKKIVLAELYMSRRWHDIVTDISSIRRNEIMQFS